LEGNKEAGDPWAYLERNFVFGSPNDTALWAALNGRFFQ
jgi:hypothetical protein